MKTVGPCRIEGCPRLGNVPGSSDGLCRPHYQRQRAELRGQCSVEGCSSLIRARDLCVKHLTRLDRFGTLELPNVTIAERFWALVDRRGPDDCWPWLGAVGSRGYGRLDWTHTAASTSSPTGSPTS